MSHNLINRPGSFLSLTKLERKKGYPAADHPKRKDPAIKRPGFAGQKTAQ
jgi:hypothetical protein